MRVTFVAVLGLLSMALTGPSAQAADSCLVVTHKEGASPKESADRLSKVAAVAEELRSDFTPEEILVVFDIDNTLLTTSHDFGSDAWFEWQNSLLGRADCDHLRVGNSFADLLTVQHLTYAVGDMRPTEPDAAALVQELIAQGHPVMALTARGPEVRSVTLRELGEAGIRFPTPPRCDPAAQPPTLCTARLIATAPDILALSQRALTQDERARLPDPPRNASYGNGIMMVSGQDKGVMLKLLLASTESPFKAIVFADDSAKNIVNLERAFADEASPRMRAFWYTAFEESKNRFFNDPQRLQATAQTWRTLSSTLCSTMGTYCGP